MSTNEESSLSEDVPRAKLAAIDAMRMAVARQSGEQRLTQRTIRGVIDLAWRHQFADDDRSQARRELRDLLEPEFLRAREGQ